MTTALPQSSVGYVTSATLSHAHQAWIALDSLSKLNPNDFFYFFISDAKENSLNELTTKCSKLNPKIIVFGIHHLKKSTQELFLKCFEFYNAFEMSNVAKYIAVQHILINQNPPHYLAFTDGDTFFLNPSSGIIGLECGDNAVLLISHLHKPFSIYDEQAFLVHGFINSGFSVFNSKHKKIHEILNWLIDRVWHLGFCAPSYSFFVDQLWVSALPILFNSHVKVLYPYQFNIAYWNLNNRLITVKNKCWMIDDQPLIMFHFSGFQFDNASQLSKHSQIQINELPYLKKLCSLYSNEIYKNNQYFKNISRSVYSTSKMSLLKRISNSPAFKNGDIFPAKNKPLFFERAGALIDKLYAKLYNFLSYKKFY